VVRAGRAAALWNRSASRHGELINRYSWPTKVDARVAIFEWIEVFYNRLRIHTKLD
jgi:transposase InsO family protein